MTQWDDQLEKIKQLIEIMKKEGLVEMEIKQGNDKISIKKGQTQAPAAADDTPKLVKYALPVPAEIRNSMGAPPQENLIEIKSPLVGTFYAQPSPDSEPYIEVGSRVDPQSVVCIIEAMKVMNEIKAEVAGTIVEVVAVNGEAVEYGQVLFRVRPD